MARLSTPDSPGGTRGTGGTASSRARWIALLAGALGVAAAAIVLLWSLRDPAPAAAPQPPPRPQPEQARVAQPAPEPVPKPAQEPPTEPPPPPKPEPAPAAAPAAEAHLGADGVLAVRIVVPMHSSTIPEVRIPAATRGVRLLLDAPSPSSLDGLSVSVRGPGGRVRARITRNGENQSLAIELDAALQPGVHELLVTNDDETTLAHHRFRAVPDSR